MTKGEGRGRPFLSPVNSLCLLVLVDMFAVALVVPLLHQYYKASGVQSGRCVAFVAAGRYTCGSWLVAGLALLTSVFQRANARSCRLCFLSLRLSVDWS